MQTPPTRHHSVREGACSAELLLQDLPETIIRQVGGSFHHNARCLSFYCPAFCGRHSCFLFEESGEVVLVIKIHGNGHFFHRKPGLLK